MLCYLFYRPPKFGHPVKTDCVHLALREQSDEKTRFWGSSKPGSTTIYGYPQKGGVWILKQAFAPEFDFLGLDRSAYLHSGVKRTRSLEEHTPMLSSSKEMPGKKREFN